MSRVFVQHSRLPLITGLKVVEKVKRSAAADITGVLPEVREDRLQIKGQKYSSIL